MDAMREVPGVDDVHDLHVWALSDGFFLLSAHVAVPDQRLSDTANLLTNLKTMLRGRFEIEHATIEVECLDCRVPQRQPIHLEGTGSPASRPRLNAPRAGPPSGIRRPTEHQGSVGPTEAKGRG
jgi:cobalt-zinc-cadmium efflux system protein